VSDNVTPHSRPASSEPPGGWPGTGGPQWTRRNFIYGSAAAAAATAFVRGAGLAPGGPRRAGPATGDSMDALTPGNPAPYVCGQASQTSGVGTTVTVPITQGTGAGDAIVVCITTNGGNKLSAVTDNAGNAYTAVNTEAGTTSVVGWIYACVSPSSQLTTSSEVTVTFSATSAHSVTVIGVPGATTVDTNASALAVASASSATPAVQITPSTANETLIALEANGDSSGQVSWTAPFQPIPVAGGGTITMVALSNESALAPDGLMVAGGDVEGYFLTSNDPNPYGYQWSVINSGVYGQYWRECACIAWSQLEQSADGGGVIYACTGDAAAPSGGGFLVSADYGNSWTLRSPTVQFNANVAGSPLPTSGWPRSTGNLLAQDPTNKILYAATYSDGVYRCATDEPGTYGTDWDPIGPSGQGGLADTNFYCRSLALHPNLTTLFVATSPYDSTVVTGPTVGLNDAVGYVWMTTNNVQTEPYGSVEWVQLTGLPNVVEELAIIGDYIYAACGYYGVYWTALSNLTSDPSYAWTSLNNSTSNYFDPISISTMTPIPPNGTNPYWATLSGYSTGSGSSTVHTIVAFCDNPQSISVSGTVSPNRSIVQVTITDPGGGANQSIAYADLVAGVNVNRSSYPITPTVSQDWWYSSSGEEVLGGSTYQNAHITIDTTVSPPVIYATGSQGFYYYSDGAWQIAINGMPLYSARSVAIDPGDAQHLVWGDSDWCSWDFNWNITSAENLFPFFQVGSPSKDTLEGQPGTYPPVDDLEGFALAFDQEYTSGNNNNAVYISTGEKYTNDWGDVIYHEAVATGSVPTWTSGTGLCGSGGYGTGNAGGNVALGLAVARDLSGNQYVIAAVDSKNGPSTAGGIWLLSGGSWSNPITGLFGSEDGTPYQPITIPASPLDPATPGNSCVYVLDLGTGYLYRSAVTSLLSTSLQTWTKIWSYSGGAIGDHRTGYLALNPTKLDELWISTPTALYQIENASEFTPDGTPTTISSFPASPGAIAIAPGGSYGTVYCIGVGEAGSPNTQLFASTDDGSTWDSVGGPGVAANASYPGNMVVSPDGRIYIAGLGNIVAYGYPSAGVTPLGETLHAGSDQYTAVAGQMVTTSAPVTISGSITNGAWIMLVAAFET
jgi:hypothetical protein